MVRVMSVAQPGVEPVFESQSACASAWLGPCGKFMLRVPALSIHTSSTQTEEERCVDVGDDVCCTKIPRHNDIAY